MSGGWSVEHMVGTAAELHERSADFSHRVIRVNEVSRPAVVLSSTQSDDVLDQHVLTDRGLDVVRRSSGGGLVYLGVGEQLWVDLFLPRADELWVDDVSHSGDWLGRSWVAALETIGIDRGVVAGGAWSSPELGRIVCFAATGPGEVTVRGHKLVGVSQRRTRAGARFQCTIYRTFSADVVLSLVSGSGISPAVRSKLVAGLRHGVGSVLDLLPASVPSTPSSGDVMTDLLWALVEHLP